MNKEKNKLLQQQLAREMETASEALNHIGALCHDLGWPKYAKVQNRNLLYAQHHFVPCDAGVAGSI